MTVPHDYPTAIKAAMLVARQAGPPFRYQVVDASLSTRPVVALTLTKWAAWILATELATSLKGRFTVLDLDGNWVEPPQDMNKEARIKSVSVVEED